MWSVAVSVCEVSGASSLAHSGDWLACLSCSAADAAVLIIDDLSAYPAV